MLIDSGITGFSYEEEKRCLNCGRILKEETDPIAKIKTGHIFSCECSPNTKISIG